MVLKVTQSCDVDITGNVLAITKAGKSKHVCEWQAKVKIQGHSRQTCLPIMPDTLNKTSNPKIMHMCVFPNQKKTTTVLQLY